MQVDRYSTLALQMMRAQKFQATGVHSNFEKCESCHLCKTVTTLFETTLAHVASLAVQGHCFSHNVHFELITMSISSLSSASTRCKCRLHIGGGDACCTSNLSATRRHCTSCRHCCNTYSPPTWLEHVDIENLCTCCAPMRKSAGDDPHNLRTGSS